MNGVDFQPSADYDNVVVNGSWNGWQGWGVVLADEDGDWYIYWIIRGRSRNII